MSYLHGQTVWERHCSAVSMPPTDTKAFTLAIRVIHLLTSQYAATRRFVEWGMATAQLPAWVTSDAKLVYVAFQHLDMHWDFA